MAPNPYRPTADLVHIGQFQRKLWDLNVCRTKTYGSEVIA